MAIGRPPKPVHLHVVEGTFRPHRHRKRLKSEPKPVGTLSEPPVWFTDGQREVWAYGLKHVPDGVLRAIDLGNYVAWCVACDIHRLAVEELNRLGVEGLTAKGSRGAIQNPLIAVMNQQAHVMLKLASEMGFSPVSRARVTVDRGRSQIRSV